MELLKGEPLEKVIQRGALTAPDFSRVVEQTLEALIAAESAGMVHRDLKPANIMVIWLPSGKFQIKILDFGLAALAEEAQGGLQGSIYFMAPEQFEKKPPDKRSDLYSLGCIFYCALAQRYPFQGENAAQVMASHLQHAALPLGRVRPDLPPWITDWVMWLISRQPDARPQSAKEALDAFRAQSPGAQAVPAAAPAPASAPAPLPAAAAAPPAAASAPKIPSIGKAGTAPPPAIGGRPGLTPPPAIGRPAAAGAGAGAAAAPAVAPAARPVLAPPPVATAAPAAAPASPAAMVAGSQGTHALGGYETDDGYVISNDDLIDAPLPPAKSHFPTWALITIPVILLGFGYIFMSNFLKNREIRERNNRVEALFDEVENGETPYGTAEDVEWLVDLVEGGDEQNLSGSVVVLTKLSGSDVDPAILKAMQKAVGDAKLNLIAIVAQRGYREALPAFIQTVKNNKDSQVRQQTFAAIDMLAEGGDVPELLLLLDSLSDPQDRRYAEDTVLNVARKIPDEDRRVSVVGAELGSAEGEKRMSLLRILSSLGGEAAFRELERTIKSGTAEQAEASIRALGNWPNGRPAPFLLDLMKAAKDDVSKLVAFTSLLNVVSQPSERPASENVQILKEAMESAPTERDRERRAVVAKLSEIADPDALAFAQLLTDDEKLGSTAKLVADKIQEQLGKVVKIGDEGELPAEKATLIGAGARIESGVITDWEAMGTWVKWNADFETPGTYSVSLKSAAPPTPASAPTRRHALDASVHHRGLRRQPKDAAAR
ncbi:MAG: protein kinase [Verrucomicrobiales bacterium]